MIDFLFTTDESSVYRKANLTTNCYVARSYKKPTSACKDGVLCSPTSEFGMLEKCTICNKIL